MAEKWTLAEGIEKLLPAEEAEINDLGTPKRHLCLDVSIAEGQEDGEQGISVILSTIGIEEYLNFSALVLPEEGESLQDVIARIARILEIKPEEQIWKDGEDL